MPRPKAKLCFLALSSYIVATVIFCKQIPSHSPRIQLFEHQQTLAQLLRVNDGDNVTNVTTNSTVMKPAEGTPHNWASLREVGVKSLRLFDVAKGSVLVGILLVDPMLQVHGVGGSEKGMNGIR